MCLRRPSLGCDGKLYGLGPLDGFSTRISVSLYGGEGELSVGVDPPAVFRVTFTNTPGEQRLEVHQVMDDMRVAGIDFLTMGQYLQPTPRHATVEEYVTPDAFKAYASIARAKGFLLVAASPLTRSSYHAGDDFAKMRDARNAKLASSGVTTTGKTGAA